MLLWRSPHLICSAGVIMKPVFVEARDLPDAWFQCIYKIFEGDRVHEYTIDRGSFEGHRRREFDLVVVDIALSRNQASHPRYSA